MNGARELIDTPKQEQKVVLAPSRDEFGWLLVGLGGLGTVTTALRRRPGPLDWPVSVGLMGAGLSLLLERRHVHIVEAEEAILEQLERLDPIARAQVLKGVAKKQFSRRSGSEQGE